MRQADRQIDRERGRWCKIRREGFEGIEECGLLYSTWRVHFVLLSSASMRGYWANQSPTTACIYVPATMACMFVCVHLSVVWRGVICV